MAVELVDDEEEDRPTMSKDDDDDATMPCAVAPRSVLVKEKDAACLVKDKSIMADKNKNRRNRGAFMDDDDGLTTCKSPT